MDTFGSWTRFSRRLALVACAPLALATATCQLGDLVKPDAPGKLAVSPVILSDSAPVGSAQTRTQSLSITTDGSTGGAWHASLVRGSGWLTLARVEDTVPTNLTISLKPNGLNAGMYRDTIQLTSGDRTDDTVRVPVSFSVFTQAAPQHPPGTPTSLGQFRIDGTTNIAVGGLTIERTVIFKATVTDPDAGDSLRLEAEVQPLGVPFGNVPNAVSARVANGANASAAATGLSDYTSYHWQARVSDRSGALSSWTSFGGNGESEADFRVVLPPTRLAFLTEPSNTAAGAAIGPAVRVAVQDAGGSTLSYFNGDITVALSNNPVGARLGGTTTVTASNGIATFGNLTVDRTGTGYTLAASATGLPGVTSDPFDVGAGSATRLVISVQPSNAAAGATISPAVRVTAQDASGNVATGFTGNVTITIATNPASGTLSGTRTVAAAAGEATFGNLTIDRAGSGYTLQASASSLTGVTSTPFSITAGAVSASQSTVTAAPGAITASAGAATSTITVTARDAAGAVVPGANVTVTATGVGNTLTPSSGTTNASGVFTATFSSTASGIKTISATINATAVTQTATVTVNPGPATHLVFAVGPSTTTSGAPITPAVQVRARDAYENDATSFGANITVALGANPGGGTLAGTLSKPAAAGAASFNDLSINRAGNGYTLQASGTGVASATSAPFNITAGSVSASQSTVSSSPGTMTASTGASSVTITVTARDAAGSPLPGAAVTLAATGTGNTLTPASGTTNASGVMTASFSSTVAQGKTISATINGTPITQTASVTVTAGAAAALFFTAQPSNSKANTDISPAVVVTARDAFGNTATGFTGGVTVAIGANPSAGTLTGTTTAAAANGVVSFANLRINTAGNGYTLTTSATGLTGATSTAFNITP